MLTELTETPPPIPACRKGVSWDALDHLMMWVHTGRAHVRTGDGHVHRVDAGTGIWMPPGPDHDMWTEPGTLAFPHWVDPALVPAAPDRVSRFSVAPGWRDWLIAHFARNVAPHSQRPQSQHHVLEVLSLDGPRPRQRRVLAEPGRRPPVPRSGPARDVALELIRDPGSPQSLDEWAVRVSSSASTLRRGFLRQTGLSFFTWRNQVRLAAARDLLRAGVDLEAVAARVGFASRNGFTRAFRENHGIAPRDFVAASPPGSGHDPGASGAPRGMAVGSWGPRSEDHHVASWVYRGESSTRFGPSTWSAREGDLVVLPAGVEHEVTPSADAVNLPVSVMSRTHAQFAAPARTSFPPGWNTYLLYCSVISNTLLRPDGYDDRHLVDVLTSRRTVERKLQVPLPGHALARQAARDFLRHLGAGRWHVEASLDDDVTAAFLVETGMTYAQWCRAARMRVARHHLARGVAPASAAARVGYTQPSNFSRAFSRFHGLSPREYQERQLDLVGDEPRRGSGSARRAGGG